MTLLSLLDIRDLNNKRRNDNKKRKTPLPPYCYTAQWSPDKESEYIGKLKSVKPSYSPGKLECIFDAFHYTSVDPKEKLFAVTDCLPNYEELKQDFQNDEEQMAKELARAMDACGKEKCRKEQNAKKNARNKLNSDKPTTVKKDTSSFFDYNKCITQKCDTIYKKQMNHFGKQFTMKNYKAYTKKGTRKRGVYNQLRGLFSRR